MPPLPRFLRRPRLALALAALLLGACATPPKPAPSSPATAPRLAAPSRPEGADALARWRAHFEALNAALSAVDAALVQYESADAPLPETPRDQLAPLFALLGHFTLAPGETLVLPPIHGPETPFPDHHPLRQIASLRTIRARLALADGDAPAALALVRENLAQARATLRAQEGLIPLIHAVGVWQCALDGVHALARSPALSDADARALLAELQSDAGHAQLTLDRALHGEYAHVYRVIVERMPRTDDPDLALSAVASLGMAEPEALAPGELGLGLTEHRLLDPAATLEAYEADLAPYLASLARTSRHPHDLYARTTAVTLDGYRRQLGAFYDYAGGETQTTLELIVLARAAMESTPNPIGKLLAIYLTPPWEVMFASTLRRDAQRSALCGLLAWRLHGHPAPWGELVAAGLLPAPPADPFSDGALCFDLGESARVWSVYLNRHDDGGRAVEGNEGQPPDLVWLR